MQGKQNSYQSIWSEGLVIRSKSLAFSKMSHKTEKFSKLVCGKSFGSFWIRYEIVSSKDAFFKKLVTLAEQGRVKKVDSKRKFDY